MRVVGIDSSSDRVRAVEAEVSFGRVEVRGYHEASSLAELRDQLPAKIDRLVVGMPPGSTTFRVLSLPTKDRSAIRSAVLFELEDELPFDGSDVAHDFSVLAQTKTGSEVYFEAARLGPAQEQIQAFAQEGLDPDTLTTDTWAYRTLLNRSLGEGEAQRNVLLIHLNEHQTTLYFQYGGAPRLCRHTQWGTRRWVEALSSKYGLTVDQARKTLEENGFLLSPSERSQATQDQKDFSKVLEDVFRELLFEIRQLQLSAKRLAAKSPEVVILTGPLSRLQGLRDFIQEELKVPTEVLKPLALTSSTTSHFNDRTEACFALAAGYVLIGCGLAKMRPLNLRRLVLAKGGGVQFDIKRYRTGIGLSAIVLSALIASVALQNSIYSSRTEKLNDRLEAGIKSFFGYTSKNQVRILLGDIPKLKTQVEKELQQQREIAKLVGNGSPSPLRALRGLSARIPKSVVVDMTEFKIGSAPKAEMTMAFLVSNPPMAESLAKELASLLDDLQRGPTEEVEAPEGGKKLRVVFTGKAKAKLYE